MTLGQHWFSWSVCWDKSWATLTGVLASKPGPVKTKYLLVRDQAAAASQPDLAPVWPVGMPVSSWHTWTHIFSLGFYLLQTSHHKLESNFTLNVVPVRLPSRDKVPVCPCLIHEEHLLRVSDETWQWHKMKVDTWARLAKSWKMWEGVALQIKAVTVGRTPDFRYAKNTTCGHHV